jgi:hypothetical protein
LNPGREKLTAETQRPQRLRTEDLKLRQYPILSLETNPERSANITTSALEQIGAKKTMKRVIGIGGIFFKASLVVQFGSDDISLSLRHDKLRLSDNFLELTYYEGAWRS